MGGGISEKSNLDIGTNSKVFNWGGISEKSNLDRGTNSKFSIGGYLGKVKFGHRNKF